MAKLHSSKPTQLRFVVVAAILSVLPLLPSVFHVVHTAKANPVATFADLAFPFAVHLGICGILFALTGRVRSVLPFVMPAAALGLLESFYFARFGIPSGPHLYGVLADTNADEVLSWLGPWLAPLCIVTMIVLAILCWACHVCWRADWRWRGRSRLWAIGAAAGLAAALYGMEAVHNARVAPYRLPGGPVFFANPLSSAPTGLRAQFENSFPWGLPWRVWRFVEHWQALQSHHSKIVNFQFGVQRTIAAPPAEREVYVLVIGESARADRWGIFGSARATTPRLSVRTDLSTFTDAVSSASATREAVSLMLTRRPPNAMLEPTGEPSAVTLFRQAGFKTYWFSNQGSAGEHETPISVMAHEAHEVQFINGADYKGTGTFDGQLLPLLRQTLARKETRQFIVLHTLGSHNNYADRYPTQFNRFQPALPASDRPDLWSEAHKDEMINAYDNSVLYTDTVLDQIIEAVAASGAVATLLYVADHGQVFFDGDCGQAGHGFAAVANYRVPMFVWTSPAWQAWRPEGTSAFKARSGSPVSTMSVFPTLAGLAGLAIPAPHAHPDLGSDVPRIAARMVTHHGDFDRNVSGKSCDVRPRK